MDWELGDSGRLGGIPAGWEGWAAVLGWSGLGGLSWAPAVSLRWCVFNEHSNHLELQKWVVRALKSMRLLWRPRPLALALAFYASLYP